MLTGDPDGALEHVAKNLAKWTQKIARAIKRHRHDSDTEQARRRSGGGVCVGGGGEGVDWQTRTHQ